MHDDPSFWKSVADWLWLALAAVGKWAWNKQEKLGYERNTDAWRGCIASEGSNRGAVRVVR